MNQSYKSKCEAMEINSMVSQFSENVYFKRNPEKFKELLNFVFVLRYKANSLARRRFSELLAWISRSLPSNARGLNLTSKIYWILHGLEDYPTCQTCKKNSGYVGKNVTSLKEGYSKHCCYSCASRDPDVLRRSSETCQRNNGSSWPMQSEKILKKSQKSVKRKYKVENISQLEEIKKRKLQTATKNFGEGNRYNREKASKTNRERSQLSKRITQERFKCSCKKNIGVCYPTQSSDVLRKQRAIYFYKDQYFRSSWELAKYIWHEDHGDDFTYQPDIVFKYIDCRGKEHFYFPDFIVNGRVEEVKGDQFFDEDGDMTLPYKNKKWSDEEFEYHKQIFKAKQICMKENDVVILTKDDIKVYISYISEKYGRNYLKNFYKSK